MTRTLDQTTLQDRAARLNILDRTRSTTLLLALFVVLGSSRDSDPDQRLLGFSRHLLAHADEHRDIFPAMVSKRGGALIQHLLRNLLLKVVREDVKEVAVQGGAKSVPEEATVQFIAGGLFGLMMWWLGAKRRLSVEEVDGLFRRLALPALKAAAP
jgi:hypothetical protein